MPLSIQFVVCEAAFHRGGGHDAAGDQAQVTQRRQALNVWTAIAVLAQPSFMRRFSCRLVAQLVNLLLPRQTQSRSGTPLGVGQSRRWPARGTLQFEAASESRRGTPMVLIQVQRRCRRTVDRST